MEKITGNVSEILRQAAAEIEAAELSGNQLKAKGIINLTIVALGHALVVMSKSRGTLGGKK
ncbi:TPA: hypothetical protein NGW16_004569 [Vibrio parahaemolyticus]|nr:hypothetical protein [Vibrio parahaemolyticus]